MKSLTQSLKNITVNKTIPAEPALKLAVEIDYEREQTKILLKSLEGQVGMHWGEEIKSHLAKMDGTNFNSMAYNYERLPSGQ